MGRFAILLLGLSLTAASCNISDPFSLNSGAKGVLKSEDGGQTFHTSNKQARKGDISGVSINMLTLDSGNPNIIYLGHAAGIHKSEDGGKTWEYLLTGIAVGDIAIDPSNSNTVYVAGITANNGKIIKSFDAGKTWIDIYTEPSKGNAVLTLAVSKANPKIILAGLNSGEIIRSVDEGHTWQLVKDFEDRVIRLRFNPRNNLYALGRQNGLSKSADEGLTWTVLTNVLTSDSFLSRDNAIISVSLFHELALDTKQTGVIYIGTEEGLLRSVNDGESWAFLNLPVKNSQLSVSAVAVNPANSNNILVAIGPTIFKSSNGALTWETKRLATGQTVRVIVIDPESPNIIYLGIGDKKK